jgi:hypothetical protein
LVGPSVCSPGEGRSTAHDLGAVYEGGDAGRFILVTGAFLAQRDLVMDAVGLGRAQLSEVTGLGVPLLPQPCKCERQAIGHPDQII